MTRDIETGQIVVGLEPGRVRDTFTVAATLAHRLGTGLVCVTVDPSLVSGGPRADGSEMIEPIDPDTADTRPRTLGEKDAADIRATAAQHDVALEIVSAVGDPARALARVAEERSAVMIVVGTRAGTHRVAEFFTGSVAARLTHQQHRPVLVVPVEPVGFDTPLPWTAS